MQGGALIATPALSLGTRVCSNSERGLLGVAVDPAFASNRFIYLFYTFNKNAAGCPTSSQTSPVERVSRFTLPDANVIDPASELVLIDNVLNFAGNHNGGDVRFGTDGYLYASISDGGRDYAGDSGCGGANDASRDRNILNGKILRIAKDGSLPPDNPGSPGSWSRRGFCSRSAEPRSAFRPRRRILRFLTRGGLLGVIPARLPAASVAEGIATVLAAGLLASLPPLVHALRIRPARALREL